jgi:energy-converting hydrogenase A subunit P
MKSSTFVQQANLFSYLSTACLRNEYYHNNCTNCLEVCPYGAFDLVRNKLTLFEDKCVECAGCIGSCPTEALQIQSFDPNVYTASFADREEKSLSCKQHTPCLGVFDTAHFMTMTLQSSQPPVCDMAHCAGCKLNEDGNLEATIRANIETANQLLKQLGVEKTITTIEEEPETIEHGRRAIFRQAFQKAKSVTQGEQDRASILLAQLGQHDHDLPMKIKLLKDALRANMTTFTHTRLPAPNPLVFMKTIRFDACTNCGDCIQFCPTHALSATPDKQGILFTSGDCIGCGICDHICKTDAITTSTADEVDLVEFAYDRQKELVHYEMVMCHECRTPYPYKGGDPICDTCQSFVGEFGHLFTLAKDM